MLRFNISNRYGASGEPCRDDFGAAACFFPSRQLFDAFFASVSAETHC